MECGCDECHPLGKPKPKRKRRAYRIPLPPKVALSGLIHPLRPYAVLQFYMNASWQPRRGLMCRFVVVETDGVTVPQGVPSINHKTGYRAVGAAHIKGFIRLIQRWEYVTVRSYLQHYHEAMALCDHLNLCHQLRKGVAGISFDRMRAETDPKRKQELIQAIMMGRINR